MTVSASIPKPKPSETEEQFSVRAHRELMDTIPDWRERNSAVWNAWDSDRGLSRVEEVARANFPANRFIRSPGHCYFVEHEKAVFDQKTGEKTVKKFGVKDLCEILRANSFRALERESFAAITDGHTIQPTESNPNPPVPDVLAYAGNYRMGMIGRDEPKFAIFGDEFHDRSKVDRLAGKPRRSIELLTMRGTGERFFDPIAALGAHAPQLPMPAKYTADHEDAAEVERYQFLMEDVVSVDRFQYSPSGSNTFIPSPEKNSAAEQENANPESGQMNGITNEDIAQIVEAIMSTPQFQWVEQQMKGGTASPGAGAPPGMPAADPTMGGMPPSGGMPPGGPQDDGNDFSSLEDDDDDNSKEPNRMSANYNGVSVERYTALEGAHNKLVRHVDTLTRHLEASRRENSDTYRKSCIERYCAQFQVFDKEEEEAKCLYSAGSGMSDEEFEQFQADRIAVGSRIEPLSLPRIPMGYLPGQQEQDSPEDVARYSALATAIHAEHANKGEHLLWDDVYEKAKDRLRKK